mmetsp:Transcript_16570/g.46776  ORF Transcript_16570/g.46776 Transcript_16570/m.46776 type:complete len:365 (-) Transcript_16570:199-1293(-)|eukprot:CAMPEP_0119123882 /NCGR_PEP_ID=MMETSP1310-20130426/3672_1 /TAXON_ID=464262 /ORGANISM="Genus nov. species nov., Strain RCC2339" /LENGTH=364 /DNA_ID=CAMNT_0007113753 /DNA_START=112 /DNA_END=1206 /DNA_ORIENTATION=+
MKVDIFFRDRAYFAGATLVGYVNVTKVDEETLLNLTKEGTTTVLQVIGEEEVEFKDDKVLAESHRFLNLEQSLVATELRDHSLQFDFEVVLPDTLPASFKSKHGRVYYEARVQIKYDNFERTMKTPFTLRGLLTTAETETESEFSDGCLTEGRRVSPTFSGRLSPTAGTTVNNFGGRNSAPVCCEHKSLPFVSGKVSIGATLNASAYRPGEKLHVTVSVNNRTSTRVRRISVSLVKEVSFTAKGRTFAKSKTYDTVDVDSSVGGKQQRDFVVEHKLEEGLVPTIEGMLVNVRYYTLIRLGYAGVMGTRTYTTLPVTVVVDKSSARKVLLERRRKNLSAGPSQCGEEAREHRGYSKPTIVSTSKS